MKILSSEQRVRVAERMDLSGEQFICLAAKKEGYPGPMEFLKAVEPTFLGYSLDNIVPGTWDRLDTQAYRDSKILLCLLYATMGPRERARLAKGGRG